jgi:hypothetical protein
MQAKGEAMNKDLIVRGTLITFRTDGESGLGVTWLWYHDFKEICLYIFNLSITWAIEEDL